MREVEGSTGGRERQERMRPGVEREYDGGDFVVTWEPRLCIHSRICFQSLPEVFQPWARPWVKIDRADRDRTEQIVRKCPSQALKFIEND